MRKVLSVIEAQNLMSGSETCSMSELIRYMIGDLKCVSLSKDVSQIVNLGKVLPIPGTRAWVTGTMKQGMDLLPVVNTSHFLRSTPTPTKQDIDVMVVKDQEHGLVVGLIVDRVIGFAGHQQMNESKESVRIPRALDMFTAGICMDDCGESYVFLDLIKMIKSKQFHNLEL